MGLYAMYSAAWALEQHAVPRKCALTPVPSSPACSPAVTADQVTDRTPIAAQCVPASSPAAARPFETVYATPNDVIYSAMVVASPRQGEI